MTDIEDFLTLLELRLCNTAPAFTFLDGDATVVLSFADLGRDAKNLAAHIQAIVAPAHGFWCRCRSVRTMSLP